jgi:hypothetical protein
MYEDQLIQKFIDQKLSGWTTRREWLSMDLVAVKVNPVREYGGLTFNVEVFEFKSDHDNPTRIFEQLPYYVWAADKVWLILGEKQKKPKGLPRWLGVQKYDGKHFQVLYEAEDEQPVTRHVAFAAIKGIYLPQYALPSGFKHGSHLYESFWVVLSQFIKKWFANSVLAFNKKPLIPYSDTERAMLYFAYHVDDVVRYFTVEDPHGVFEHKHIPVNHEDLKKLTQTGIQQYM